MASVLLTGGTGALGRAVEPALLERGHTVHLLSRREQPAGRGPGSRAGKPAGWDGEAARRIVEALANAPIADARCALPDRAAVAPVAVARPG